MVTQIDVDAVNDRLKDIVATLNSIGISPTDVKNKDRNIAKAISEGKDSGDIEALLKSLYELQQEAPKIMAALASTGYIRKNSATTKEVVEQNGDDDENDDEEEEDSDDDNWPTVGRGISDDISVMSDLTTPTVMDAYVDEEEHYRELQLPMVIGGDQGPAMVLKPPKRKSILNPVKAGQHLHRTAHNNLTTPQVTNPAPSGGGAAAKRRNQYSQRMAMLGDSKDFSKKPLPDAKKVQKKKQDSDARFSFSDIALERSAWDPDELSTNAFETAIYGEPPKSPDLLDSPLRTGKSQKQSLMDDTDELFESGYDAFVPFTGEANPFAGLGRAEVPPSPPRKSKTKKSKKSKKSKSESSPRRKKTLALF